MILTNLFISSYREATVIKFGEKKQLLDKVGHFSIGGRNDISFWSCGVGKSLYLQL